MVIYLFCNAGMSTSMVASLAKKAYAARGKEVEMEAFDLSMLPDVADEADVLVFGPQIAWRYEDAKKEYPDKVVLLLTMKEFGSMNGDVIVDRIENELKK